MQPRADPAGRLVWISPTLPGAPHDMGAAREHGIVDALNQARIQAIADTAYQTGVRRSGSHNGDVVSIRIPVAIDRYPVARSTSTAPTLASAARASGSTRR